MRRPCAVVGLLLMARVAALGAVFTVTTAEEATAIPPRAINCSH
jgi:hypothetical protein